MAQAHTANGTLMALQARRWVGRFVLWRIFMHITTNIFPFSCFFTVSTHYLYH